MISILDKIIVARKHCASCDRLTLEQRRKSDDQHSCMTKGAMPRRVAGSPGIQALLGIVVVTLLLYGFYSYHGVKAGLRVTEENMARLRARHESLAAQMQGGYAMNHLKILYNLSGM